MERGPLTNRGWLAVRLALVQADRQGRPVGTAHLLLGVLEERENLLLADLGVDPARVEANLRRLWETGPPEPPGQVGPLPRAWWRLPGLWERLLRPKPNSGPAFTEEARQALLCAAREAEGAACLYVGPEHLVLGLASVDGSRAARVLEHSGADAARLRQALSLRRGG